MPEEVTQTEPLPISTEDGLAIRTLQLKIARAQLQQSQAQLAFESAGKAVVEGDKEMEKLVANLKAKYKADGYILQECLKWAKEAPPPQG